MVYEARILRVDLDRETVDIETLEGSVVRNYIGGVGLGAYYLAQETNAGVTPFSPDNRLMFMIGPVTGLVPQGSRAAVCALSPLSDGWGEAFMGGTWGAEFSYTGFDGIIFTGRAKKPLYLYVNDGEATLREASHIWGKDTWETDDLLKAETDSRASVASIGRAGERLVRFSGIVSDGRACRIAARCGVGAVMGSKNLKAVVVRGTQKPAAADRVALDALNKKVTALLKDIDSGRLGVKRMPNTSLARSNEIGTLCVKNQSLGTWDSFAKKFLEQFHIGEQYRCRMCPIGCLESHVIESGREMVLEMAMPVGANCMIDDLDALQEGYEVLNRYGMDTVSFGYTLALAMELYERGIITKKDTGGIDLTWGNAEAMIEMARLTGECEGFGKVLAQGSKRAAEQIGGDAPKYAMHVKGLEVTHWDPRVFNSLALAYATGNKGGSHLEASAHFVERRDPKAGYGVDLTELGYPNGIPPLGFDGKAALVKKTQDLLCLVNSVTMCQFSFHQYGVRISQYTAWLNAVTGWDMTPEEFLKAGERIFNAKRLINVRHGIGHKDDRLPERLMSRLPDVADEKQRVFVTPEEFEEHLQGYYAVRGWSKEGVPTDLKRKELGLS